MAVVTKTIVGNDTHCPYHDPAAVNLFLQFIEREKPDRIILLGDLCDFYSISKYNKDPNRATPKAFKKDLIATRNILESIRKAAGDAQIDYIQGNHEMRLRKYLWKHAAVFADLEEIELPALLHLRDYDMNYHTNGVWIGDLYLTHGSIVRKHAGYTARAEFEKNGCTGMSAHTHRDGKYTVRNRSGQFAWWENYCLCKLDAEYIEGIANWSQGFACITTVDRRPYVEQIPIISGKYIYGGKIYSHNNET